jgi:hypothetical protein
MRSPAGCHVGSLFSLGECYVRSVSEVLPEHDPLCSTVIRDELVRMKSKIKSFFSQLNIGLASVSVRVAMR